MTQGGISFVCRCRCLLQRAVDANTFEALRYANEPLATSRKNFWFLKITLAWTQKICISNN